MSWLNVNMEELNGATDSFGKGQGLPEPGIYEGIVVECYIDSTKTGTKFFALEFVTGSFPNDQEIKVIGWDVNRMVTNKNGASKNSKGNFFTGVILLNKMAKCIGKTVNDLIPTKKLVEQFGQQKEVGSFNELVGKTMIFGIRHKKYYKQDSSEGTKLDLVDVCCKDDKECADKLKARIEKKPIIEDNSNKPLNNKVEINENNIPF